METPNLVILDVGHGNCALLKDTEGVVLIDCPPGAVLLEVLEYFSITEIDHVLISHADRDHIAGLPQLLLNIKVKNIHLNSDWLRETKVWKDVRVALANARQHSGVNVEAQLITTTTGRHNVGQVSVKILAPVPELALAGVGGSDPKGKRLRPNSLSAVVSLEHNSRSIVILAGDLDQVGLDNLLQEDINLEADVLVFPHHGGKPGARVNSKEFAQQLCEYVRPKLVIFSIDRSLHRNPNDEIVEGVISAAPEAYIMCTQLSEKCAANLPITNPNHLSSLPAKGLIDKKCCGGTIVIGIGNDCDVYTPVPSSHRDFVMKYPNPICRRFSPRQQITSSE